MVYQHTRIDAIRYGKPPACRDIQSGAIGIQKDLVKLLGADAIADIRHSFEDALYWKTEAKHLYQRWGRFKCAEGARLSITDWQHVYKYCYLAIRYNNNNHVDPTKPAALTALPV